jgi:hypothetical protein
LFTDEIINFEIPRSFSYSSYNQQALAIKSDEEKLVKRNKSKANRSQTNTDQGAFEYSNTLSKNSTSSHHASTSATITPKLPEVSKKTVSNVPSKKSSMYSTAPAPPPNPEPEQQNTEKLMITGDDVLIEYVARLMIAIKSIREKLLRQSWKHCIDKFIKHYVWHSSDTRRRENNKLWQRLESRLIEMKERRKRLLRSLYKKEVSNGRTQKGKDEVNAAFEKEYEVKEQQKNVIIQALSALELEDMLRTSTKNVAHEVVS